MLAYNFEYCYYEVIKSYVSVVSLVFGGWSAIPELIMDPKTDLCLKLNFYTANCINNSF